MSGPTIASSASCWTPTAQNETGLPVRPAPERRGQRHGPADALTRRAGRRSGRTGVCRVPGRFRRAPPGSWISAIFWRPVHPDQGYGMCDSSRRAFMGRSLVILGAMTVAGSLGAATAQTPAPAGKWICPPCGCAADGKDFDAPGVCPACGIDLVPKPAPAAAQPPQPSPSSGGAPAPTTTTPTTSSNRPTQPQ